MLRSVEVRPYLLGHYKFDKPAGWFRVGRVFERRNSETLRANMAKEARK